jgi:hypothetical protein
MAKTTKVVIANGYTSNSGRVFKAGEVVELPAGEARVVLGLGKAREYVAPVSVEKGVKNG